MKNKIKHWKVHKRQKLERSVMYPELMRFTNTTSKLQSKFKFIFNHPSKYLTSISYSNAEVNLIRSECFSGWCAVFLAYLFCRKVFG